MNKRTLNRRMRDNYEPILKKMSPSERAWAEEFETMEYAVERGHTKTALAIRVKLSGLEPTTEVIANLDEEIDTKFRCNPVRAEAEYRKFQARRTTKRGTPSTIYDSSDWLRTGGTYLDEDGHETEIGVSVSPEDALVEALDAARKHSVDLEVFLNTPALWEQPRGRGRPKKETV